MQTIRNTEDVRFSARISAFITVMLVRNSKLIANSESVSKPGLEKPQDEVSQLHPHPRPRRLIIRKTVIISKEGW